MFFGNYLVLAVGIIAEKLCEIIVKKCLAQIDLQKAQ